MTSDAPTERTRLRRSPHRGQFDRESINAILDEAYLCHLAVVHNALPVVVPTLFGRDGDDLVLHGSPASRAMRAAREPIDVSVNVTLVDGIVVARSGFHSSMNYRSVTIYGQATEVTDLPEKQRLLGLIVDHIIPNRSSTARPMTDKEVRGTMVLRLPMDESSAKVRAGWPEDDPDDYDLPVWAGIIPVTTTYGAPRTDPAQRVPVEIPIDIVSYQRPGASK